MRPVNTPSNFRSFHLSEAYTRPRTFHPLLTSEPIAVSISDGQRISGHGFGFDYTSHLKAKGEYLERFITLRAVPYTHRAVIKDMAMTPEAQNSVLRAISETCSDKNLLHNLQHHLFRTVNAESLITHKPVQLPWIFFSLHTHEDCLDCSYVPIRDTSGSAFHTNETCAREAALLEFIERQNLTAMWAARRCLSQYTLHADVLEDPQSRTLVALLEKKGVLTVYDISFIKGVTSVFVTYKAKASEDYVQFSCGASAALNPQDALKKAIIETWQTGLLLLQMPIFKEKEYGGDELKEAFQKANYHTFDPGIETIPEERVSHTGENPSLKTAILSLAEISPHIFLYQQHHRFGNNCGFYCKIFSPDFFVHMNPGEGNNNNNTWVKKIAQGRDLRLENIPFS